LTISQTFVLDSGSGTRQESVFRAFAAQSGKSCGEGLAYRQTNVPELYEIGRSADQGIRVRLRRPLLISFWSDIFNPASGEVHRSYDSGGQPVLPWPRPPRRCNQNCEKPLDGRIFVRRIRADSR
jgi:hypothetical protein